MAMIVVVIVVLVMVMGIMMMMLMVRASLISEHIHIKDASDPRSMRGLHSPGGALDGASYARALIFLQSRF